MLAIITKMTLTQVSTWFANARRRLKKENKMTWSPRNRCGEKKDDVDECDEAASDSDCDDQNCEDDKLCDTKDENQTDIKGIAQQTCPLIDFSPTDSKSHHELKLARINQCKALFS